MKKFKSYLNQNTFNITSLVIIILIVYYPIFYNDFLYEWDDQWQVITKTTENGFNWNNLFLIFTQPFYNQFFPINQFLYMIIHTFFGGYNAWAFHAFCLFLHLINSIIIYFLLKKVLFISQRMDNSEIKPVSILTALLFAIHPLNVESVAWISASKVLVYSVFYLLALYTYIIYCQKNHIKYLIFSLCLFILSFLGKEQAIILPVCLLVFDWLLKRDFNNKKIWIEKIPFFLLAFILGCFTLYLSHGNEKMTSENYSIIERIIFSCYSYLEYLFKYLFPFNLLYLYPFPSLPGQTMPFWLYSYPILLLSIIGCFWRIFQKHWQITFGLIFFTVNLLLILHLIPLPRFIITADRYIYLPSIGLSFIISYLVFKISYIQKKYRVIIYSIVAVFFIYWGCYTNLRIRVWHDSDSLKKEVKDLLDQRKEREYINKEQTKSNLNSKNNL